MYSVKESKELLTFIARLASAVSKALEDGKINVGDIGVVFEPLLSAKAAFEDIGKIPQELLDLDEDEAAELVQTVQDELELSGDIVEELSEEGLAIAFRLVLFINKIRNSKQGE